MRRPIFFLLLACFFVTALSCVGGCLQHYVPQLFPERGPEGTEFAQEREEEAAQPERAETVRDELPAGALRFHVYFVEGKNKYMVPVTFMQPWTEGVARAALERLIKGPTPAEEMRFGLSSPLPPQTAVLGINIRAGTCRVDFSRAFLDYDPGREREILGSVIHTLLQFNTVEGVEIMVEGSPVTVFPGGTAGEGVFDWRFRLNPEESEGKEDLAGGQHLRLYFCTVLGESRVFYVPVTRVVAEGEELLQTAVRELLRGPQPGSGLFSELPPGTELKGLNLQGGVLTVDLSRELINYQGGLSGEENIKNQLLLTLTGLPGVERVRVLVEGQALTLPYGTALAAPLPPPLLFNRLD